MISLLARLRKMGSDQADPGARVDRGDRGAAGVRDDVLLHLRQMTATRFGSAPCSTNLGLPDLTDIFHGGADAPMFLARSLQRAIQAYEPRLVNVQVSHIPADPNDPLLRFEIRGQLVTDGGKTQVLFETRIDPSRRVMIR